MTELTQKVIDTFQTRPNVAVLMSLGGSNAERLLGDPDIRKLYDISTVVSDQPSSRGAEVAGEHGLDYLLRPVDRFRTPDEREAYFDALCAELGERGVTACFYAGFMKISKGKFVRELPGINAHPADLTVTDESGVPLFRGMDAISAMRAGTDGMIGASTHVVADKVDTGATFIRSLPIHAPADMTDEACHQRIKQAEHQIYPLTLRMLGKGLIDISRMPYTFDEATGILTDASGKVVDYDK